MMKAAVAANAEGRRTALMLPLLCSRLWMTMT